MNLKHYLWTTSAGTSTVFVSAKLKLHLGIKLACPRKWLIAWGRDADGTLHWEIPASVVVEHPRGHEVVLLFPHEIVVRT